METSKNVTTNVKSNDVKGAKTKFMDTVPDHIVNIARLLKNNAEIRRFTGLAILNYLTQTGEIQPAATNDNGMGNYVNFRWDKFVVNSNGLAREYRYTEEFFINALYGAFPSFANAAGKTIEEFMNKEKDNIIPVISTKASTDTQDNATEHKTTKKK